MNRILVSMLVVATLLAGCGSSACHDRCVRTCPGGPLPPDCDSVCATSDALAEASGCKAQYDARNTCETTESLDDFCSSVATTCESEYQAYMHCVATYCAAHAGAAGC